MHRVRVVLPLVAVTALVLGGSPPVSGDTAVTIHGPVNSDTEDAYTHIAPRLAADPADPDHLVLVDVKRTGVNAGGSGFGTCMTYVSEDGGANWSDGVALPVLEGTECARRVVPRIAYGDGAVYVAYYVSERSNPWPTAFTAAGGTSAQTVGRIVVARSEDGGHTWSEPTVVPPSPGPDTVWQELGFAPWAFVPGTFIFQDAVPRGISIAADPEGDDVWVGWSAARYKLAVWVARSTNRAESFDDMTPVTLPVRDLATGHLNPWTIYRPTMEFAGGKLGLAFQWLACRDFDPFCNPVTVPTDSWWFRMSYAESLDRGETFSEVDNLAEYPVWDFEGALPPAPALAIDPERPHRVYVSYEDQIEGDNGKQLYVVRTLNESRRIWLPPVRIGDDPYEKTFPHERLALDIAPGGRVDAVWYDGRNDSQSMTPHCNTSGPFCQGRDVYYTFSTDAGTTWAPNIQITETFEAATRVRDDVVGSRGGPQEDALASIGLVSTANEARFVWEQSAGEVEIEDDEGNTHKVTLWDVISGKVAHTAP